MATAALRQVLARRLRAEIAKRKRKIVPFADFAHVSPAHVYDVLAARKAATVDFIERVAEALEIPAWELLRDEQRDAAAPGDTAERPTAHRRRR